MGRRLQSALDLLKPNLAENVERKQTKFTGKEDRKCRDFVKGDDVYIRNLSTGPKWLTGKIVTVTGPVSFVIALNDGRFIRRHVDHIRKKFDVETPDIPIVPASVVPCTTPLRMDIPDRGETREESKLNSDRETPHGGSGAELRTSTRERYKPTRYGDNIYD